MNMTIQDLREFLEANRPQQIENGLIGKYVIVRCRDAGVHAGVLESHSGREAVLTDSRRLWKWVCANGAFLSGLSQHGLDSANSTVGTRVPRIHLTETCEIIGCSDSAETSIRNQVAHRE